MPGLILPGGTLVSMPDRTDPEIPEDEFAARWAEIAADLSDLDDIDPSTSNETAVNSPRTDAPEDGHSSHRTLLSRDNDPLSDDEFEGEPAPSDSHASGPRDWTPAEEDGPQEDGFLDYQDAIDVLNPVTGPSSAGSPNSAMLWLLAGGFILVSLLMVFSVIPGGGVFGGALGFVGFGCGAFAAFASSPHEEDVDPFDDGARL